MLYDHSLCFHTRMSRSVVVALGRDCSRFTKVSKVSGVVARRHEEVCQLSQLVLGEGGRVLSPVVRVGPLPVLDRLLDRSYIRNTFNVTMV